MNDQPKREPDGLDEMEAPKPNPLSEVLVMGLGRKFLLESYEDVKRKIEEAEPGERIELTTYFDTAHTDKRIVHRVTIAAAAVLGVEEWTDEMNALVQEDRDACRREQAAIPGGPMVIDLRSFGLGGG